LSQLTKRAIVEVTMCLVEQKTIKKITVRDIVEACGITRNTFYYHFHDIYEVLEYALAEGFERIGAQSESFEEFLDAAFMFCVEYQKVLYNLYHSIGYEALTDYLKKQVRPRLARHLQNVRGDSDGKDAKLVRILCEEALVGTLMRWICNPRRTNDPADIEKISNRIQSYFGRAIRKIVQDTSNEDTSQDSQYSEKEREQ